MQVIRSHVVFVQTFECNKIKHDFGRAQRIVRNVAAGENDKEKNQRGEIWRNIKVILA